jgi:hypothetical protein
MMKYNWRLDEVTTKLFCRGICGADLHPKSFLKRCVNAGGPNHVSANLFDTIAMLNAA